MEQLKLFDEDAIDIMANEVQEFWDEIAPSLDETQQRELDRALLDLLHFSFHYIEMSNTDDKYDKNMILNLDTLPKWIKMETKTNERTRETQSDCYFWSNSAYNNINYLGDYYFYNYHANGFVV
jgi:hypothetical protein